MDFITETFPDTRVHITLYRLASDESDGNLHDRKQKLSELLSTYRHNFTLVNASLVTSLSHLNIAISRALLNKRDGKLKTESFGNEIVYYCDPQYSIQSGLQNYGL